MKEPSTWAGLGAVLASIAPMLPGVAGVIVGALAAACGAAGVHLRERGLQTPPR